MYDIQDCTLLIVSCRLNDSELSICLTCFDTDKNEQDYPLIHTQKELNCVLHHKFCNKLFSYYFEEEVKKGASLDFVCMHCPLPSMRKESILKQSINKFLFLAKRNKKNEIINLVKIVKKTDASFLIEDLAYYNQDLRMHSIELAAKLEKDCLKEAGLTRKKIAAYEKHQLVAKKVNPPETHKQVGALNHTIASSNKSTNMRYWGQYLY